MKRWILSFIFIFASSYAYATLAIDGTFSIVLRPAISADVVLTTTHSDDVIIVCGYGVSIPSASNITSVVGGGLTFVRRSFTQMPSGLFPGFFIMLDCWWAYAPSPLSSVNFVVNFSASLSEVTTTIWGVSGSSLPTTPWDPNISLPSYSNDQSGASTTAQTVVSTDNIYDDMLIWVCDSSNNGVPTCGIPPGFSAIAQGGASFTSVRYAYKIVVGKQNLLTLSDAIPLSDTYWNVIGDAIVGRFGRGSPVHIWISEEE